MITRAGAEVSTTARPQSGATSSGRPQPTGTLRSRRCAHRSMTWTRPAPGLGDVEALAPVDRQAGRANAARRARRRRAARRPRRPGPPPGGCGRRGTSGRRRARRGAAGPGQAAAAGGSAQVSSTPPSGSSAVPSWTQRAHWSGLDQQAVAARGGHQHTSGGSGTESCRAARAAGTPRPAAAGRRRRRRERRAAGTSHLSRASSGTTSVAGPDRLGQREVVARYSTPSTCTRPPPVRPGARCGRAASRRRPGRTGGSGARYWRRISSTQRRTASTW